MLTEHEVSLTWTQLFRNGEVNDETFTKAENLIEELRPESPLRTRLHRELKELRQMHSAEAR